MERNRTHTIRDFILDQAAMNPRGLARRVAEAYGISRQAANRHLDLLVDAGLLEQAGQTRAKTYHLKRTSSLSREVRVTPVLNAGRLWEDHIAAILSHDAPALREICRVAFDELMRNAVAHAGASWIRFSFVSNARDIDISVTDDGRGILSLLAPSLGARTPRETAEMLANLANARSTDSPAARLVLLARNFQSFAIRSAGVALSFDRNADHWRVEDDDTSRKGTAISFRARRPTATGVSVGARRGAAVTR